MAELDLRPVIQGLEGARLCGPLLYHAQTASTNDDALALAATGAPEGTVVIAGRQTHGRGRRQRSWFGHPDHSLLFTVLLRPPLPPEHFPRLVNVTGVAVAEGCAAAAGSVQTKWPNDLVNAARKLGGILIETRAPDVAVLGIGLNVLGEARDFPPELQPLATTLAAASGVRPSREQVLLQVLTRLDHWYGLLVAGEWEQVLARQRELESTLGTTVTVQAGGETITGEATDLAAAGGLVLRTATGERVVELGEVLWGQPELGG